MLPKGYEVVESCDRPYKAHMQRREEQKKSLKNKCCYMSNFANHLSIILFKSSKTLVLKDKALCGIYFLRCKIDKVHILNR